MTDQCRDVLVERNLSLLKYRKQSRLFLMSLVDRQFYDSRSQGLSGEYEAFKVGWDSFKESYRREQEHYQLQFSEDEALTVLTLESLPGAVEAWRDCMLANKRGLFTWLEGDLSAGLFTLWLEWAPPTGIDGKPLQNVRATLASEGGTSSWSQKPPSLLRPGKAALSIRRESRDTLVRGEVNGEVGTGSFAVSFMIPRYVEPTALVPSPYLLAEHPESLLGQHNVHGGLQFGKVYWQAKAVIANVDYTGRALGMHAPHGVGYADFAIPPGSRYFSSVVGMARQDSTGEYGSATCRVYIDGNLQWQAQLTGAMVTQTPNIGIPPGAAVLRLEVDGGGANWADHTTWGDPRFKEKPNE